MNINAPPISPMQTALTCRCPRCGKAPLFRRGLELREACTNCDLDYKFIDTGDGPAVFAIFILGFFILGGALWLEFTFEPALWVHVVVWGIATPLVALFILRFLKSLLIALQYVNKAEEARLADD